MYESTARVISHRSTRVQPHFYTDDYCQIPRLQATQLTFKSFLQDFQLFRHRNSSEFNLIQNGLYATQNASGSKHP
jgi:hypothetical protein